jgi:hypothetical protein
MKKENKIITLIINLAKFIFSEVEFNKFFSYLKLNLYNAMRIFVEEKLGTLETKFVLNKEDAVIEAQIEKCRRLDTVITDLCISNLAIKT